MTIYDEGLEAARQWLAGPRDADEPTNPHPRKSASDPAGYRFRAWSAGYERGLYEEFGDPSADESRAERNFGA
jgi:hypothetical protein